jgi:hypothetical protein
VASSRLAAHLQGETMSTPLEGEQLWYQQSLADHFKAWEERILSHKARLDCLFPFLSWMLDASRLFERRALHGLPARPDEATGHTDEMELDEDGNEVATFYDPVIELWSKLNHLPTVRSHLMRILSLRLREALWASTPTAIQSGERYFGSYTELLIQLVSERFSMILEEIRIVTQSPRGTFFMDNHTAAAWPSVTAKWPTHVRSFNHDEMTINVTKELLRAKEVYNENADDPYPKFNVTTVHWPHERESKEVTAKESEGALFHENGPDPSKQIFWWNNSAFPLRKQEWRLALCLWGHERVPFIDVSRDLWGNDDGKPKTIRALRCNLAKTLATNKVPIDWHEEQEVFYPK